MNGFGYFLLAAGIVFLWLLFRDFALFLREPGRFALFDAQKAPENLWGGSRLWGYAWFWPLALWVLSAMVFALYILFIALVAMFYSFALFHGEFSQILKVLPHTAGNIILQLCYPIEALLMGILLLVLFLGLVRMIWGSAPVLSRIGVRVKTLSDMVRECAQVILLLFGVILLKIAAFISITPGTELKEFFSRRQAPRLEVFPLVALFLMAAILVYARIKTSPIPGPEPGSTEENNAG